MTTVLNGDLELEGLFHEGRGPKDVPCLVCSPHPVFGGSMDSPICAELAWAITRTGSATLRFNYRGVGASQGRGHQTSPQALEELSDLRAAAAQLRRTAGNERVSLAGYSFGAWLASYVAAEPEFPIHRLVLVAPPINIMPFDFAALSARGVETAILAGQHDQYLDWDKLLEVGRLPRMRVEKIPDADHFFMRGLAQLGRLAANHVSDGALGHEGDLELPEDDGPPLELDT
ncbi:MAG: alpha/beta fold hydrolase [Myxococcota bacterium]